jgi:hypothetical protein
MESEAKPANPGEHFKLLRFALGRFGEILLYGCFAMPFAVESSLALFSLRMPSQAVIFGTVWPYYSVVHLTALLVGCGLFLLGSRRSLFSNRVFIAYAAVNLIAICLIPFLTPRGQPVYWDYALEFLRLSSLVLLATTVLEYRRFDPRVLAHCLLIVAAIPLVFLVLGNPADFLFARAGRVNGPGLELTSTGHIAAIVLLLGISLPLPKAYRGVMIALGIVDLLLSGARIPFVLALGIAIVQLWYRTKRLIGKIAIAATIAGSVATVFALGSASSPIGRLATLTGNSEALETEYTVGRGMALLTTMKMFSEHPLGYVDSDWAIQRELVDLGFPSHTHSHYFQSYLRYGPLMFVFWGMLIAETVRATRRQSPYATTLWFIAIGSALDYYGFVTKAMLVVFMVAFLNQAFISVPESALTESLQREVSTLS